MRDVSSSERHGQGLRLPPLSPPSPQPPPPSSPAGSSRPRSTSQLPLYAHRLAVPPPRWYRLSRLQRQVILYGCFFGALALLALLVIGVPAAASGAAAAAAPRGAARQETVPIAPPVAGGGGSAAAGARAPAPAPAPPPRPGPGGRHTPLVADAVASPYCGWNQLYLPQIVSPDHYDLDVTSDLRRPPYAVTGDVRIRLAPVTEVTPCVVLHAKGMDISSVTLIVGDEEAGDVIQGSVLNRTDYEQVVLKFGEAVPLAPAVVSRMVLGKKEGFAEAGRPAGSGGGCVLRLPAASWSCSSSTRARRSAAPPR
jgi:hypothetical protein